MPDLQKNTGGCQVIICAPNFDTGHQMIYIYSGLNGEPIPDQCDRILIFLTSNDEVNWI